MSFFNRFSTKPNLLCVGEIVSNFNVLHFDEIPILYYGYNQFGNKVIGSHLDEDDDEMASYALHVLPSDSLFYSFFNRQISYLNLIKASSNIFVFKQDYSGRALGAFEACISEISEEFLPRETSFCPKTELPSHLSFCLKLKGGLAELARALPHDISLLQEQFAQFLENRIKRLKNFSLLPQTLINAYSPGSFKINLEFEIKEKSSQPGLFINSTRFEKYLNHFVQYMTNDFNIDSQAISQDNPLLSAGYKELRQEIISIYENASVPMSQNIEREIRENIIDSIESMIPIIETVGSNYSGLEIFSVGFSSETPISFFDSNVIKRMQESFEIVESNREIVSIDQEFNDYTIYIYHLNTDTRRGSALIKNPNQPDEMFKPKFRILGDEPLEQTKYTESLYRNKWIPIKAKAKRIGEKLKHLEIEFENTSVSII